MAEQISTIIDESKLVGGEIINEQILESQEEEKTKEKETEVISETLIDESKLVGGEEIEPAQITSTTDSIIDESKLVGGENVITGEAYTEPTNWERLEYGWDKETMVLGNVFRVGKAYVQDIFDDDKTFKDYIVENEKKRLEAVDKEHWKFRGREDEGGITTVGSIASMILDPYYLAGYLNPVSLKAMTNPVSSATLNALLISGDVIIDNLAKTGEVDWNEVALTGATAGAIGAVIPIGGKIIKKYAPKFLESEVKLVADFIDRKIAKTNNISTSQLKKIQTVSQSAEVKAADKELIKWTRNFVHPITAETKKFRALEKTLLEKRNLLIKVRKLTGRKKPKPGVPGMLTQESPGKQIIKIRQEIIDAKKASEIVKKDLIIKQQDKLKTWSNLVANRNTKILEQLRKNETSIDWAARTLFSATVRPLVGAGMGTVGGILFGDEETDLMYWAAAGAVAGQMQKMIARSSKFGTKLEKGKILGVIDRELTQLTLQKVRDLMSSTSSTKLDSYGGATREIGKLLLREVDSPVSQKSVIAIADQMQRHFFRKADKIFTGYTDDEIAWAISINRGKQLTKETPKRVEDLSKNIKGYIDEFRGLSEGAGFFPKKELDDYFPRVLDWDAIKKDEKAFINTVKGIYESLGIKGKVASGPNKGRLRSEVAAESYFNGHKTSGDSVFNAAVLKEMFSKSKSGVSKSGKKFIYAPVSEHITHQRALQGPYKLVEEVLEKNGYLVNDGKAVLSRVVNDSIKSIAFARQFGTHGELLQPFFQRIRDKYVVHSNLPTDKALSAANQEMKLVANTIDAYFDRYGTALTGAAKSSAGIIATLGNANMLGRVTISSLGDIIQPLQNSGSWRAIFDGFKRTAIRQSKETGPAKALGLDLSNTIQQGLQRSAGFEGKNVILNNSWIGKSPTQTVNNIMFKALGLEWLTGFARRFAYNVGVSDAYYLSKTLNKLTAAGKSNSGRAKRIRFFLNNNYEITTRQALQLGSAKTFDDAILNNLNKKAISDAGIKAANRDALIPQVDNRLLFTQSNNQWVRLMGQFLSWAQAKSAQTNRILQRIENGSAKTLVKTLAVLPIYSGVQSLREIAKHGEIVTDFDANSYKWWAEGARLSGMFGFLPELIANRFIGPGAREPWYLFAPAFTIIGAPGVAAKQFWDGNTDRALRTLNEKLAPLPSWRKRLWKLFTQGLPKSVSTGTGSITKELKPFELGGLVLRKRFKKGDVVEAAAMEDINLNQQEDMNIKDLASVAAAASIATTGVDADINKAVENNILPPPIEEEQILPEEKPLYAEGAFVDYIEQVENPNLKYGMIHKSAEGGNDTIAFGHKLTDEEIKNNKVYSYNLNELTEENAKHILLLDLQKADEQLQVDYGEKYNKLDKKRKQMLIDFQYNMGSERVKQFKNFKEGLFSNDRDKMKEEYERGFTNKEGEFKKLTNRNKEFFNYFFVDK